MYNFVLPVIFGILWLNIRVISQTKNGFYGAPLAVMKQSEKKHSKDKDDIQDNQFPASEEDSTNTSIQKKNDSDDEENLYFDQDIECQPLFKKSEFKKSELQRYSCPEEERFQLQE